MSKEELEQLLSTVLIKRQYPLDKPTLQDWEALKSKFQCDFNPDFVRFMEAITLYQFPGELYDVARGSNTTGNGTIAAIYDLETGYDSQVHWNTELIPFYGVGNGDCFCLSASMGEDSPVFYVYHEDGQAKEEYPSFEAFLKGLPELLSN